MITLATHDPQAGRFLNEDRKGFRGGVNFYAYTGNHATNFVDPFGNAASITYNNGQINVAVAR